MKKNLFSTAAWIAIGLGTVGCTVQKPIYSGTGSYSQVYAQTPQAISPEPSSPQSQNISPSYQQVLNSNSVMVEKLASDMNSLYQRMQRAERAMIRLDRRMQLIERNELGRMGSGEVSMNTDDSSYLGSSIGQDINESQVLSQVPPAAKRYPSGIMPVTASLQPAQRQVHSSELGSFRASLPSLADDTSEPSSEPGMAVWTVRYVDGKVWPDRNQLPASRNVVSALKTGKPVALFARGAQPNSKEFRDRVRALSRYLSKVAESSGVAISAMPAQHLDEDTIEIFATR
ncbi:MAG: hypothetical protein OXR68_01605 [Alphaproteobacteria bacterium]|nr:hypothetical protein [Alphaproteobacteria bacterium]MDD9919308.1 hypothetical protein [Alphaproteobacteria bacterium]